jgi:hypothetical protein
MHEELQQHVASLRSALTARLDELDEQLRAIEGSAYVAASPSSLDEIPSNLSQDLLQLSKPFSVDDFVSQYYDNSELALTRMIAQLRGELRGCVHTKRLIEKSNLQYVDMSFQKASTRLTALINQKVTARHHQIESELSVVMSEIDSTRELMVKELAGLRVLIQDCRSTVEEIKREKEFVALGTQQRSRPGLRKGGNGKVVVPLLRSRTNVQSEAVEASLALQGMKPV